MIESGSLLNAARRSRIGPTADCGGCWSTASSAPRHQGCPAGSAPTSVLASGNRIGASPGNRSEEHTSELQSLMRTSYAVFCLKKKKTPSTQSYVCTSGVVIMIYTNYY